MAPTMVILMAILTQLEMTQTELRGRARRRPVVRQRAPRRRFWRRLRDAAAIPKVMRKAP
jgi:hypothetical protein